jgi:hypothetical protein
MADWSNKEFVLAAVRRNGYALQYAHNDLKKDKEIVLASVTEYGYSLYYVHDDFKNDREIVLAAVTQNGNSLEYAHDDLKNDEEFLYEVDQIKKIEVDSNIFNFVSERIKEKIREKSDYLLNFAPVYLKPAKK